MRASILVRGTYEWMIFAPLFALFCETIATDAGHADVYVGLVARDDRERRRKQRCHSQLRIGKCTQGDVLLLQAIFCRLHVTRVTVN